MFRAIIVRPANGRVNQAWTNGPMFDKEALWQASIVDTCCADNLIVSGNETARFNPDSFLINGLDTPAAIVD